MLPKSLLIVAATIGMITEATAKRCENFTGTYGVYAVGSGKANADCRGAPYPCILHNNQGRAELLPDRKNIHRWIVNPLDEHWAKLTAVDRNNCKEIVFSNGTIWKMEN